MTHLCAGTWGGGGCGVIFLVGGVVLKVSKSYCNMDNLPKDVVKKIKKNISHNNHRDINKYGYKGTLTYEEFMNKINSQGNKCYVCSQEFKYNGGQWCYFFPSADRIYNYSRHTIENIGISCLFCNIRMFKGISVKSCGLCEGLDHTFEGSIITKSQLFYSLGNNNELIYSYVNNFNKKNRLLYDEKNEVVVDTSTSPHVD